MYKVYRRSDNLLMGVFGSRSDAVYWCKVNQISSIPDGEWEDDYYILSSAPEHPTATPKHLRTNSVTGLE